MLHSSRLTKKGWIKKKKKKCETEIGVRRVKKIVKKTKKKNKWGECDTGGGGETRRRKGEGVRAIKRVGERCSEMNALKQETLGICRRHAHTESCPLPDLQLKLILFLQTFCLHSSVIISIIRSYFTPDLLTAFFFPLSVLDLDLKRDIFERLYGSNYIVAVVIVTH